jgi:hypothetical protein
MSPQITVSTNELASTGGVPTGTGVVFAAGTTDSGPPAGGAPYVLCQSLAAYVNAFGARSNTSAALYDFLDEVFHDGGTAATAYITRVSDSTATTASVTLSDAAGHPTVVVTAQTPGAGGDATFLTVAQSGGQFTVAVEDSSGDILEEHGPYTATSALFADATSEYVTFSQATATGNTTAIPVVVSSPVALAGGADASDLTDASHVTALGNFPASLGPGTVCLPGKTSVTAWNGLDAHAQANNRFSVKDMADASSSSAAVAAARAQTVDAASGYGMFIQGSLILPGVVPNTTRTVAGSAAVAALRAQVAATPNQNTAPAGERWPLNYPQGFTTFFGPSPATSLPSGQFAQSDVNTMTAGGVNCFANFFGTLCLFGFVTPLVNDAVFNQASSVAERMNLVAQGEAILANYLFDNIDQATIDNLYGALSTLGQSEYAAGALYGDTPSDAFSVLTAAPINSTATAQAGGLYAQMEARFDKYADRVGLQITAVAITGQVIQPTGVTA